MPAAQVECVAHEPDLGQPLVATRPRRRGIGDACIGEQSAAHGVVDRPAVVRVDQGQLPELVALVQVRNAGGRQLQCELAERDAASGVDQGRHHRFSDLEEVGVAH